MNIAIIDDHQIFLDGFELLINDMKNDAQVSSFQEPQNFLTAMKNGENFDLIICDLVMKSMNGMSVSAAIRETDATVPILILSGMTASDPTQKLKQIGVNGFVHKSLGYEALATAITTLLSGASHFPDETFSHGPEFEVREEVPKLWDRHMDVLQLLAGGATNKEISDALQISENTVKTYLRQLFNELGANTRTACVHKAQLLGII